MADRKLSIAVKADLREGQKLTKYLTDLATVGSKVAKSFSSIVLGGGGPTGVPGQKIALGKTLQEDIKLMKALGAEGEKFGKVMKAMVASETEKLSKSIKSMTDNLKEFTRAASDAEQQLKEMIETGASPEAIENQRGVVDKWRQQAATRAADLKVAQQRDAELNPQKQPWYKRDLLGGQGTQQLLSQLGLGGLSRYAGVAGVGIAAYQGVNDYFSSQLQMSNQLMQNRLKSAGLANVGLEMMTGNVGTTVAYNQAIGANAGELADVIQATVGEQRWGQIKGAFNALVTARPGTMVSQLGELTTTETGMTAAEVKAVQTAFVRNLQQSDPLAQYQANVVQGMAGNARQFGRIVGGSADAPWTDVLFGKHMATDARLGLEQGTTSGLHMQLVGRAGRAAASKLVAAAAAAVAGGMDEAAVTGVLSTYAAVGGGGAMTALRRVTSDAGIRNILASGATQMGGPMSALVGAGAGIGAMGFGINDLGPQGQARIAQQGIIGAQMMSQIMGGQDNYQRTMNLVNATRIAGGNASVYTSAGLSMMGTDFNLLAEAMANPNMQTGAMKGLGITGGMLAEQGKATIGSMFNRILRDPATMGLPGAGVIKGLQGAGMDLHKFFGGMKGQKRQDAIEQLSGLMWVANPEMFQSAAGAEAWLRTASGLGGAAAPKGAKGRGATGAADAVENHTLKMQINAEAIEQNTKAWQSNTTLLNSVLTGAKAGPHLINRAQVSQEAGPLHGTRPPPPVTPTGHAVGGHRQRLDERPPSGHER